MNARTEGLKTALAGRYTMLSGPKLAVEINALAGLDE